MSTLPSLVANSGPSCESQSGKCFPGTVSVLSNGFNMTSAYASEPTLTDDPDPDPYYWVGPPTPRGDTMKREPVLTISSLTALVTAIVALLVAFGLDLTNDQQNAILGVAAIAAPIVVGLLSRPKVTPVASAVPNELGMATRDWAVAAVVLLVVLLVLAIFTPIL